MKRSILFDALKLLALFGLIWAGFYFVPKMIPDENPFTLSVENEEKIGDLIVEKMIINNPQTEILKNPVIDSAVFEITQRLTSKIGPTDYEYKIKVINDPQINAFTLPGGNIFIYSGLIEFADNPEQVAAVLAHEIGHAEKRHIVSKLVKELGIGVLFSILAGDGGVIISEIFRTAASTVFDRSQEREADEFALKLLEKASIEPVAMAAFFRKLDAKTGGLHDELELLMTHPNNSSRVKAALEYKKASAFQEKPFTMNWERVKAELN